MEKKRGGVAAKVALVAGCGALAAGALCVLGIAGLALVPVPQASHSSSAAEPATIEGEADRDDDYGRAVPGCRMVTVHTMAFAKDRRSTQSYPELQSAAVGLAFVRGTVVSTEPRDELVVVRIATGVAEDEVLFQAQPECVLEGVRPGVEVVASGGWLGARVDDHLARRPLANADAVVTAAWWDEAYREWMERAAAEPE